MLGIAGLIMVQERTHAPAESGLPSRVTVPRTGTRNSPLEPHPAAIAIGKSRAITTAKRFMACLSVASQPCGRAGLLSLDRCSRLKNEPIRHPLKY